MKKRFLKPIILFAFIFSLGACSKDGDKKTNLVLLTQAAWKYQAVGVDADKNGNVDSDDPLIEACDKDDVSTFKTDNTGTFDEGATKCDPADPQTENFAWQFTNGEKEIVFDGETYKILSLDDNNLKIYDDIAFGGSTIRYLIVLKH